MSHVLCSPKRVIAGGPANPVAIVDETADLAKAAKDISDGASFDNNIMCISEKCIVAVESIVPAFVKQLEENGVYYIDNETEMLQLTKTVLNHDMKMVRKMEGKSAMDILEEAGIHPNPPGAAGCGAYLCQASAGVGGVLDACSTAGGGGRL